LHYITKLYYTEGMKEWTPVEVETFRKEFGLTRKILAELTGVTVSSIYQWERGIKQTSKTVKILLSRIEEEYKMKTETEKKGVKGHGKTRKGTL
jgi:DNA-binding transcriptional regulator YiaG